MEKLLLISLGYPLLGEIITENTQRGHKEDDRGPRREEKKSVKFRKGKKES